jgi:hypothetical protein
MGTPEKAAENEVEEILEKLEKTLLKRIPLVYERSPEGLFDELSALELVLDLEHKLKD